MASRRGDFDSDYIPIPDSLPARSGDTFGVDSRAETRAPGGTEGIGLTLLRWGLTGVAEDAEPALPAAPPQPSFRLVRVIGRGGMGEVWEAEQTSLGRIVAVKRIDSGWLSELADQSVERRVAIESFQREACIAARLEHPNIVPIHDQGIDERGTPLLAMKRVVGEPWNRLLRTERGTLSPADFIARHVGILVQVSQAVAFAHSRGIVHRDIKPSQVMIGEFGEVMLTDWGLAIDLCDTSAAAAQPPYPIPIPDRARASGPCGTPAYMAPEQTEKTAERIGRWTDVYLLAGTLYLILTNTNPHPGEDSAAAFRHAAAVDVEDPRERAPQAFIPEELARLCNDGLRRDPQARLESAGEFTRRLQEFQTGSGRRRQSAERTAEVAAALSAPAGTGYGAHADALAKLEEAASLWRDNPDVPALRHAVRVRYAEAAVAAGDLTLARAQTEALDEGEDRERLRGAIEEADTARRRQRQRLRLAVVGVGALLTVLLVSSVIVSAQFRRQRDAEAQLRADAERAQRSALARARAGNSAIDFLMGDVSKALDPQLPRDSKLIAQVADRAIVHFREMDFSEDSPQTREEMALALQRVARSLHRLGRDKDATDLQARAIGLWEVLSGKDAVGVGRLLIEQAQYQRRAGAMADSEANLARAAAIFKKHADAIPWTDRWSLAHTRAGALRERGQWAEAEAAYNEALDFIQNSPPNTDPTFIRECRAQTRSDLAAMFTFMGRRDEALAMTERTLEDFLALHGEGSTEVAGARQDLAHLLATRGELQRAGELYLLVEKRLQEQLPPDHPRFTNLYQRMGELMYALGRNEEAMAHYRHAVEIAERNYGPEYYYLAPLLQGMGVLSIRLGDWENARQLFERGLSLQRTRHGEDSPYLVEILLSVGFVQSHDGDNAAAEKSFRHALAITQKHYAPEHPNHGFCKINLAELLGQEGRLDEAEPLLEEAVANLRAALGDAHPHLVSARAMALNFAARRARSLRGEEAAAAWESLLEKLTLPEEQRTELTRLLRVEALLRLGRKSEAGEPIPRASTTDVQDRGLIDFLKSEGMIAE